MTPDPGSDALLGRKGGGEGGGVPGRFGGCVARRRKVWEPERARPQPREGGPGGGGPGDGEGAGAAGGSPHRAPPGRREAAVREAALLRLRGRRRLLRERRRRRWPRVLEPSPLQSAQVSNAPGLDGRPETPSPPPVFWVSREVRASETRPGGFAGCPGSRAGGPRGEERGCGSARRRALVSHPDPAEENGGSAQVAAAGRRMAQPGFTLARCRVPTVLSHKPLQSKEVFISNIPHLLQNLTRLAESRRSPGGNSLDSPSTTLRRT